MSEEIRKPDSDSQTNEEGGPNMVGGVGTYRKAAKSGVIPRSSLSGDTPCDDDRALEFEQCAAKVAPVNRVLESLSVGPELTVLDMWCVERLAVPLAGRSKSVTAVDFSKEVCDGLALRCREVDIVNITPRAILPGGDLASLGLSVHDVVITSWPPLVRDSRTSTIMLDRLARRRAYICMPVGDGPFDRRMYEAAGRVLVTGPSYTHVYYNLIHQYLGLMPSIVFLREDRSGVWKTREEALDAQKWMFPRITTEEEEKIEGYLAENLVKDDGRWRLSYLRRCTWAIMWWGKEETGARRRSRQTGYTTHKAEGPPEFRTP